GDKILPSQSQPGIGRYLWHTNETDPARKALAINLHGSSHRKRMVEGPQLCPWMKPVQPEVIPCGERIQPSCKGLKRWNLRGPAAARVSQLTELVNRRCCCFSVPNIIGSSMNFVLQPWQLLLVILTGWVNRRQQQVNDYL